MTRDSHEPEAGQQLAFALGTRAPKERAGLRELKGRVPFAFAVASDGERDPIEPHQARHGIDYGCPVCKHPVRRKGQELVGGRARKLPSGRAAPRPYFSHRRGASACPSTGEHWMHVLAKLYVELAVKKWLRGDGDAPRIVVTREDGAKSVPIPATTRHVHLDYGAPIEGGRVRPDVVLTEDDGAVVLVIEIWHAHLVAPEKGAELEGDGAWVVEIPAETILSEDNEWAATRTWRGR